MARCKMRASSVANFMRCRSASSARYISLNCALDCAGMLRAEKSSGTNRQRCFRTNSESVSAELRFRAKRKCIAATDSQKAKFANWAGGGLLAVQPGFNSGLVLMVPPDCSDQHVDVEQVNHGGNCSNALNTSSRETGRLMESKECFPLRRMTRTCVFGFGRSIRTKRRRPSPSGRTLTTSPVLMRASFRAFAGITICPRP